MGEYINKTSHQPCGKESAFSDSAGQFLDQLQNGLKHAKQGFMESEEEKLKFVQILKKSRRDFLMIFDSVPAAIWYCDGQGKILRANQPAADQVGMTVRELIGKNYYDLVTEGTKLSRQQDLEIMTTGQSIKGCLRRFKTKEGLVRWASEDHIPLKNEDGEITGVMIFVQDVTEKKIAEERLVHAKKEIERCNEQLKAVSRKAEQLMEQK